MILLLAHVSLVQSNVIIVTDLQKKTAPCARLILVYTYEDTPRGPQELGFVIVILDIGCQMLRIGPVHLVLQRVVSVRMGRGIVILVLKMRFDWEMGCVLLIVRWGIKLIC